MRDRVIVVLATVHTGIEPALLALLCTAAGIPLAACGWVVGAGQAGLGVGALLCWRVSPLAQRPGALAAAAVGIAAGLGLAIASSLPAVLAMRFLLGAAMGIAFARAMAAAAQERSHCAMGEILLGQQLLAAAVMAVLPLVAARWGAAGALLALGVIPVVLAATTMAEGLPAPVPAGTSRPPQDAARPAGAFPALLIAMALLVAVVMMVWSYIGALGAVLGVPEATAAQAIALTSLASVPGALAAFRPPRGRAWVTALACGPCLVAPLLLPGRAGLGGYVAAMVLFNAGSTFATIRFSAWALEGGGGSRGRRFVATGQALATAAGAPLGAMALAAGGMPALRGAAVACTAAAIVAMSAARQAPARRAAALTPTQGIRPAAVSFARSAATALALMPFSARAAAISATVNGSGFLPLAEAPSDRA